MKTKAIIFDLDGVLTDSAKYHYLAWKALSEELGLTFNKEINERLKGVSRMDSFQIILEVNHAADRFSVQEKEKLIEKKNQIYVDYIKTMTPADILPGILPFIGHAKKAGLKLAVASVSKNAGALLSALGIADQFDYIADAAKIKKSKPDPEIFLDCAQGLRVEPENCVGIEDAQAGIEAIKAAGMQAIGIHVTITSKEPDIHLQSTEELDFEQMIR